MIEPSHIDRFAAVYAEAVLTFLDSGEPQWLTWDGRSHRFDFVSVEREPPKVPAMLVVDENWVHVVGDLAEVTDPESPYFDSQALRLAIQAQMADEGYGERLLKGFQERLERLRAGVEEDEEEPDESGED